jgi:3-oxoacyl-[acyl-carrier protein] reductase
MTDLTGKVALVTGSARGIGRAVAERYAALGADLVLNYSSDAASAAATVAQLQAMGVNAVAVQADVSKVDDIARLFETALETFGHLDIVVANAGLELTGLAALDFTEEQFDRMFSVNTKGAFFTMQSAGRHVADNGRILYISSSTTGYPNPGYALHGSSKVAPEYLVRVLAHELGHRGIAVNSIVPTATGGAGLHTHVEEGAPIQRFMAEFSPMGRMGTPQDVADIAEFFAGDLSGFVSGQSLLVSGGGAA